MSGDSPSNLVWFSFCFPPRYSRRQERHTSKCTERLRAHCLRACGARHPGVRPGGGQPPHTSGHRTRHPIQFWVVRTYKNSSHRSVFSEFSLTFSLWGDRTAVCPRPRRGMCPKRCTHPISGESVRNRKTQTFSSLRGEDDTSRDFPAVGL